MKKRFAILVVAILSILGCIKEPPRQRAQAVDAGSIRPRHAEQLRWAHQALYARPTEAELSRYEQLVWLQSPIDEPAVPLSDQGTIALIVRGQSLIRTQAPLAGSWRGDEVCRMAGGSFGTRYPLFMMTQIPALAWSPTHEALVANPILATNGTSDEEVGTILFHEGTHAVLNELLLSHCAFTRHEWQSILQQCFDVRYEDHFAQEALAFLNQRYWAQRVDLAAHESEYHTRVLVQQHRPHLFAREIDRIVGGLPSGAQCGPPVIVHGPRRGQYCLPAVIADYPPLMLVVNARD